MNVRPFADRGVSALRGLPVKHASGTVVRLERWQLDAERSAWEIADSAMTAIKIDNSDLRREHDVGCDVDTGITMMTRRMTMVIKMRVMTRMKTITMAQTMTM